MRWIVLILALLASPLWAVQPDEILDDPVLEERARDLSQGLRCPVCQNESIDESNATLARELRILLRERLVAGDTDEEAVDFIVARYGEFVLLRPDTSGANIILWVAAPVMFLIALGIGWTAIRRKKAVPTALSDEEKAELAKILERDAV
ncbi:cytochrome c-type biogenesis protein [Cognatiyoonia sp. IB215446]|uniref:cytochrome c-type biogenesis protein n=1 Tax=Cognatiyoonia sp. IB215446 TaxID=3097355 RepID=UPI002A148D18|nr:cytochrome c-type biogenesis protein [Cognatiyoonia sp. IB215446]MDX8348730.1 cytochrome c-type biogenesis protein [Cognatiyoonia sp. IB215446]